MNDEFKAICTELDAANNRLEAAAEMQDVMGDLLNAQASEIAVLTKQLNAYNALQGSMNARMVTLQAGRAEWQEAVATLVSERQANAILTDEIAALKSMQADYLEAARIAEGCFPDQCPSMTMPLSGRLYAQASRS